MDLNPSQSTLQIMVHEHGTKRPLAEIPEAGAANQEDASKHTRH